MHTTTLLTALLLTTALAAPNWGPPKPKKTISLAALNDCGCAIPAFFIQECQNIPASAPSDSTKNCVCDRQWYGYSDLCMDCVNQANGGEDFPELVEFMKEFSGATKQLYSACTLTGGSVSSDGEAVCASTYYGDTCISIAKDGKSGWTSFEASSQSKVPSSKVEASFELGPFKPSYEGQTLEVPKSGYPKAETKKEKEVKDKETKDSKSTTTDSEESEETEESEEVASNSTTTATGTKGAKSNGTTSAFEEGESPINVNGSGAGVMGVNFVGLAAVVGVVVSMLA
ncbi:hypothetical protein BJ508DRAFT_415010 [Ascobolus immersus RN42]|uniref:Extracellular membrane protein CFEM domain-containing protein n=1 Tax=Ascobolus immersus RN42 TaxID=1160509 RepID=A0A3N4IH13_ASCIM|nr:hypothetical protein BJ508DRAFT_415010 [Ascobolus immersus RN42]